MRRHSRLSVLAAERGVAMCVIRRMRPLQRMAGGAQMSIICLFVSLFLLVISPTVSLVQSFNDCWALNCVLTRLR